jgi:hypothetical protein
MRACSPGLVTQHPVRMSSMKDDCKGGALRPMGDGMRLGPSIGLGGRAGGQRTRARRKVHQRTSVAETALRGDVPGQP